MPGQFSSKEMWFGLNGKSLGLRLVIVLTLTYENQNGETVSTIYITWYYMSVRAFKITNESLQGHVWDKNEESKKAPQCWPWLVKRFNIIASSNIAIWFIECWDECYTQKSKYTINLHKQITWHKKYRTVLCRNHPSSFAHGRMVDRVGWGGGVYMWGVTTMKHISLLWSLEITSFAHGMNNTLRQILHNYEYFRMFASKLRENEWSG